MQGVWHIEEGCLFQYLLHASQLPFSQKCVFIYDTKCKLIYKFNDHLPFHLQLDFQWIVSFYIWDILWII